MSRPGRGAAPAGTGAGDQTPEQEGQQQLTDQSAEVDAARELADRAKRLALRSAGHGRVNCDDLLDVVAATGRLCDVMLGRPAVNQGPDGLDLVRAAGIPVPDEVPDR